MHLAYDEILNNYILKLQSDSKKIVGVYKQGSETLGYNDNFSDSDYSVVWRSEFPKAQLREKLARKEGFQVQVVADQEHKGTDRFIFKNKVYNVSNQLDFDFFEIYNQVLTQKVNEPKLYILGGFERGEIIYEPLNKLREYKQTVKVTSAIRANFSESRKISTQNNLESIKKATVRGHSLEFIKSLNYLLLTYAIQHYLNNDMFPNSPKWFEKDAKKFGWDNDLTQITTLLNKDLNMEKINEFLDKIVF